MNAKEERIWIRGRKSLARSILGALALDLEGKDLKLAAALIQLHDVRAALRDVCDEHGDNDWEDNLHLSDVVEKHLGRHLNERTRQKDAPLSGMLQTLLTTAREWSDDEVMAAINGVGVRRAGLGR